MAVRNVNKENIPTMVQKGLLLINEPMIWKHFSSFVILAFLLVFHVSFDQYVFSCVQKRLIFRMFDDSTGSDKENTAVLFHNTGKAHLS